MCLVRFLTLSIARRCGNDDSPALPESAIRLALRASAFQGSTRRFVRAYPAFQAHRAGWREKETCRCNEHRKVNAEVGPRLDPKQFAKNSCCQARADHACVIR